MGFKNIKGNVKQTLLDYFVSGKAVQYYSSEFGRAFTGTAIQATGGDITDYNVGGVVYRTHVFTGIGTFSVTSTATGSFSNDIEYLVVAGGGSGGVNLSGGGGAGGLRTNVPGVVNAAASPLTAAPYTVSVGDYTAKVGAGAAPESVKDVDGTRGTPSEFYPPAVSYPSPLYIRAIGGGGGLGGPGPAGPEFPGGSGGGSNGYDGPGPVGGTGNTPADPNHPIPQGNPGGASGTTSHNYEGGGGGGAGAAGQNGSISGTAPWPGANGGVGVLVNIIPSPPSINSGNGYYWAGGGGGGSYTDGTSFGGDGGAGGGGGGGTNGDPANYGRGGGSAYNSNTTANTNYSNTRSYKVECVCKSNYGSLIAYLYSRYIYNARRYSTISGFRYIKTTIISV